MKERHFLKLCIVNKTKLLLAFLCCGFKEVMGQLFKVVLYFSAKKKRIAMELNIRVIYGVFEKAKLNHSILEKALAFF